MQADARSGRVAVLASVLLNDPPPGLEPLVVIEAEGWGVLALPAEDYPDAITAPLLEQVAEHAAEFSRHHYVLVLVGHPTDALAAALAAYGVGPLPWVAPDTDDELRAFLRTRADARPGGGL